MSVHLFMDLSNFVTVASFCCLGASSQDASSTGRVGEDFLKMLNSATEPKFQSHRDEPSHSGQRAVETPSRRKVLNIQWHVTSYTCITLWPNICVVRDRPIFPTDFKILTTLGFGWVGGLGHSRC